MKEREELALPVQAVSIVSWSPAEALLLARRLCCPKGVTYLTMNFSPQGLLLLFLCVLCLYLFTQS